MPFNELQSQGSWPPTIVHLHNDPNNDPISPLDLNQEQAAPLELVDRGTSSTIDENPFSFFLTSPDDIDDVFDSPDLLDAGIETPESHSPVREVSPSSLQREPLSHSPGSYEDDADTEEDDYDEDAEEDYTFGLAIPLSLKDFSSKHAQLRHTSVRKQHQRQSNEQLRRQKSGLGLVGLGISLAQAQAQSIIPSSATAKQPLKPILSPNLRGRAQVRLVPSRLSSRGRGGGRTRSLSARRQSWREPSPDIFTIREEREDDEEEEGFDFMSASAPCAGRGLIGEGRGEFEVKSVPIEIPKVKKRVHWAL